MTRTIRCLFAAGGALVGALAACGGDNDTASGSDSGCPTGAPRAELTGFAVDPQEEGQEVDVGLEVVNRSSAAVVVHAAEVQIGSTWHDIMTASGAAHVAEGETWVLDGDIAVPGANSLPPPDPDSVRVEWRWESDEHRDCATSEVVVETATVDTAPSTTTTRPEPEPPQAPPDALAIGETATFTFAGEQEIRLTVTDVSRTGNCPEPDAPPPQVGYLFVHLRLEVGPGAEPWSVNAYDFHLNVGNPFDINNKTLLCAGSSPGANYLQAAPGQTVEGTFIFDGTGPALEYTFSAYGQDDQHASWALEPG